MRWRSQPCPTTGHEGARGILRSGKPARCRRFPELRLVDARGATSARADVVACFGFHDDDIWVA